MFFYVVSPSPVTWCLYCFHGRWAVTAILQPFEVCCLGGGFVNNFGVMEDIADLVAQDIRNSLFGGSVGFGSGQNES